IVALGAGPVGLVVAGRWVPVAAPQRALPAGTGRYPAQSRTGLGLVLPSAQRLGVLTVPVPLAQAPLALLPLISSPFVLPVRDPRKPQMPDVPGSTRELTVMVAALAL